MIYSVSSRQSFEQLGILRERVLSAKGVSKLPTVLIATKSDLPENMWQVTEQEGKALAEKMGCCTFEQVSLLTECPTIESTVSQLLQEVKRCHTSSMEAFTSLDRSGVLNKTSKSLKKFRPKTYIIKDGVMYVTDGTISSKSPKLPLMEDTSVEMLPTDPTKNAFPFEVCNIAGKMFLSATCDEDRSSWVETIISNIALSNVLSSLLDDVAKVMLWEIITSPDLHAEPEVDQFVSFCCWSSGFLTFYTEPHYQKTKRKSQKYKDLKQKDKSLLHQLMERRRKVFEIRSRKVLLVVLSGARVLLHLRILLPFHRKSEGMGFTRSSKRQSTQTSRN